MNRIYKYPVIVTDEFNLTMPVGAKVLSVQVQNGSPQLWAMVDTSEPLSEIRSFRVIGTGHPIDSDPGVYIGTFQIHGGELVLHLFAHLN